jgi:hypothetical protein
MRSKTILAVLTLSTVGACAPEATAPTRQETKIAALNANGSCFFDWTGTSIENDCSWEVLGDGWCDCGCQFNDSDCEDRVAGAWDGTPYENDCPAYWYADGHICDEGCQFMDPDCDAPMEPMTEPMPSDYEPMPEPMPEEGGMPLCDDTCRFQSDGECDDGGPGSLYSLCDYGSDCTDCGPR